MIEKIILPEVLEFRPTMSYLTTPNVFNDL